MGSSIDQLILSQSYTLSNMHEKSPQSSGLFRRELLESEFRTAAVVCGGRPMFHGQRRKKAVLKKDSTRGWFRPVVVPGLARSDGKYLLYRVL